jgi:hypothetical protein
MFDKKFIFVPVFGLMIAGNDALAAGLNLNDIKKRISFKLDTTIGYSYTASSTAYDKSKISAGNYTKIWQYQNIEHEAISSKHNNSHSLVAGVNANMYFEIVKGTRFMISLGAIGRGMFGKNEYSVQNTINTKRVNSDDYFEKQVNNGKLSFQEFGSVYFGVGISQDIYKDLTIEAMVTNGISVSKLRYSESNTIYTPGQAGKMEQNSSYNRSNSKIGVSYRLGAKLNFIYKDRFIYYVDYAMDTYKIGNVVNDSSQGTALNISASFFKNTMVNHTFSVGIGYRCF